MATKTVKVDFPAEIFGVEVNIPLIHQVVVAQQAAARQGTHSTKTRGEVRGGGRKPYKQKGTGRARQGSTRAPQFAGGGVVHGPQPRNYDQRTPKKMKAAALRSALSDRARNDRIHVVDSLLGGDKPSTKNALASLAGLSERAKYLVVLERTDSLTWLSLRNAPEVHIVAVDQLNTYDVLASDDVVFTRGAYEAFVGSAGDATTRTATLVEAPAADEAEAPKPAKKATAKKAAPAKAEDTAKADDAAKVELPEGCEGSAQERRRPEGLRDQGQRRLRQVPRARRPVVRPDGRRVLLQDRRGRRGRGLRACRWRLRRGGRQVSTLHKDHRDILIAPVVSEKSYGLLDANKYTFLVRPDANKTEIKIAVEKVFNVKVTSVNTINRQGKTRRTRYGTGKRANTKRAIVSLAEGHRIDIFGA